MLINLLCTISIQLIFEKFYQSLSPVANDLAREFNHSPDTRERRSPSVPCDEASAHMNISTRTNNLNQISSLEHILQDTSRPSSDHVALANDSLYGRPPLAFLPFATATDTAATSNNASNSRGVDMRVGVIPKVQANTPHLDFSSLSTIMRWQNQHRMQERFSRYRVVCALGAWKHFVR